MTPPLIALEEHFLSEAALASPSIGPKYSEQLRAISNLVPKLVDLGPLRLADMDANGVTLQVVSHGPALLTPQQARSANDQLAAAVALQVGDDPVHRARLAGFAALPMGQPPEAAEELTRCVRGHGFVGALVDNHAEGTYYDGPAYLPFWSRAEELGVPIYLHPTWPTASLRASLYSGSSVPEPAALSIGSSALGWHSDVALHFLKLFSSGLFDTFPRLRIILGHMGELLPFMLQRVVALSQRWGHRERTFRDVWDANVWITTSGVWSVDPMACILRNTRVDRIMFSVDYPFARNEDGARFMDELAGSGLVTGDQLEMIAHRNAEALLGLKVT